MKARSVLWAAICVALLAAGAFAADTIGIFTDSRDGKKYKTAVIGGKRWMAENLNYQPQAGSSWCYGNDNSNCDKYGRLYGWNTAKTVCPAGWRLPTRQEWQSLVDYAGGDNKAGKKLKAGSGWKGKGNGTDDYRFSALPGGFRNYPDSSFYYVGSYGYWWPASENANDYAYYRRMDYDDGIVNEDYNYLKMDAFSVRCVGD